MVVSPCYVLPFRGGTDKGAGQLPISGFPRPAVRGCKCAPFLFLTGAQSHNLNPGIMSRQIYYEANSSCCVGPRSAGIAVTAGDFTKTADMALKSGSNTQVIPCPTVLFYYADAGGRNEFFNL